jgi:hypothetical protein
MLGNAKPPGVANSVLRCPAAQEGPLLCHTQRPFFAEAAILATPNEVSPFARFRRLALRHQFVRMNVTTIEQLSNLAMPILPVAGKTVR